MSLDNFDILGASILGDLASEGVDVEVNETGHSTMYLPDEPAEVVDNDYIYGCDILGGVVCDDKWTEILGGGDYDTEIVGGSDNMNWTEIVGAGDYDTEIVGLNPLALVCNPTAALGAGLGLPRFEHGADWGESTKESEIE